MENALLGKCGFYCGCCPTYLKGGCRNCEQVLCETILPNPRRTVLDRDWRREGRQRHEN